MKGELQTLCLRLINYMEYVKILTYHLMIRSFICKFCKVNECFIAVNSCSWEPHACLMEMNCLDGSSRSECRVIKWAFYSTSKWGFRKESLVICAIVSAPPNVCASQSHAPLIWAESKALKDKTEWLHMTHREGTAGCLQQRAAYSASCPMYIMEHRMMPSHSQ